MTEQNTRLGILLMITTTIVFAVQDGISRHLAADYPVPMIVMVRYWFFAIFVMVVASRQAGGIINAARTQQPFLQIFRGALLAAQICIVIVAFDRLGLVETHAIFVCAPLLVAALSGPILGESVGWLRWSAIGVGFIGVLIILRPGYGVFSPDALIPLTAALMFATYVLLTRFVSRRDSSATSFFWTGVTGGVLMTMVGIWTWTPMSPTASIWLACLCVTGALGHYLLIRTYEIAEASAVQPFTYFQLVFVAVIGMSVFDETVEINVAIGAVIVIAAGLFTLWRERRKG